MKYLIIILFFIAAFFKIPMILNGWAFRQLICLCFLSLVISWTLSNKYHVSVGLCFLVTSLYGLLQSGMPNFSSEILSSIMTLSFFSCIALGLKPEYLDFILPLLGFVAIGDAVIMIIRIIPHFGDPYGHMEGWWVLTNASLDACFVALMFPVVWIMGHRKSIQVPLLILTATAIVLSKSNTALVVLLITSLSVLPKKILLLSPIGYFSLGNKFGQNLGRFNNWEVMMTFWNDKINHWIGSGPGTYWVLSQVVQFKNVDSAVFRWMHNDWLQVLFEQGIVGLASIVFLYFSMLWKSLHKSVLFSMVLGFGIIALTLYPLHLFMFQLTGVALIYLCFHKEETNAPILQ